MDDLQELASLIGSLNSFAILLNLDWASCLVTIVLDKSWFNLDVRKVVSAGSADVPSAPRLQAKFPHR